MHACMHLCACACVCAYICVCMKCVCVHVGINVCVHACVQVLLFVKLRNNYPHISSSTCSTEQSNIGRFPKTPFNIRTLLTNNLIS